MISIPVKKDALIEQKFCVREIAFAFKLSGEGMYKIKENAYRNTANRNSNTKKP